jgi:osmotically inducible protein OsmC
MGLIRRTARLSWEGTLARGEGFIAGESGAFDRLPVTDASRMTVEGEAAKTSPEELLAGAHATCFAMALGAGLARARTPPTNLEVEATYTLNATEGQFGITTAELVVTGRVEGIDQAAFERAAADAGANCVVSKAVEGNVNVTVQARLLTD